MLIDFQNILHFLKGAVCEIWHDSLAKPKYYPKYVYKCKVKLYTLLTLSSNTQMLRTNGYSLLLKSSRLCCV